MIDEQRHQELRTAVTPLLIDGRDAITIAVKNNAHRGLTSGCAGFDLGNQLPEVGGQRLGGMAAKEGIALRADFAHRLPQQRRQTTSGRAMHGINDHLEAQALQPMAQRVRVHGAAKALEVFRPTVKAFGFPGLRHRDAAGLQAPLNALGEITFHRAAEVALDLEAKPFRRVVAGGDHQRAQGTALHHHPTAGGRGQGFLRQQRLQPHPAHSSSDGGCQFRGQKAAVVANHHRAAVELWRCGMGELRGRSGGHWQQALNGDVHPENTTPAIGAKGDGCRLQVQGCGRHQSALS